MRAILILALFTSLLLKACRKDKDFYLNGTFETSSTAKLYSARLFTKNGEILDTAVIRSFITRNTTDRGFPNKFFFNQQSHAVDPTLGLTITFLDDNTARVVRYAQYLNGPIEIHEADFSSISETELRIAEKDSTEGYFYSGEYCSELWKKMLYVKPAKNCEPFSNGIEYCNWRQTYGLRKSNTELWVPMMTVLVVRGQTSIVGYSCTSSTNRDIWNSFTPAFINTMDIVDTIAFQEKDISFVRL
jgi:hypothetical protein